MDITAIRRGGRRWRKSLLLGGAFLVGPVVPACDDGEPSFQVGDCVRIEERAIDHDLQRAGCAGAVGTFDPSERVYRVDSIIESTDGGCPQLQGFFPVEFAHEPDGVTYCLVQQG